MRRQQVFANGLTRLEQICAHRHRLHARALGGFGRRETLQIHQIEDFTLSPRQTGEELTDDRRRALAIDATTGIGRVDIGQGPSSGSERQPAAPRARASQLSRGAAMVATIWISLFLTDFGRQMFSGGRPVRGLETETIPLACLSAKDAGEIVGPYLRTPGSNFTIRYIGESRMPAITLRGTPHQIAMARGSISDFESRGDPSCHARSMAAKLQELQDALRKATEAEDGAPVPAPSPEAARGKKK